MSEKHYDIIVIGAGQHGLTTAAMAARKGLKTLVVEKSESIGGLARKEEFHPGFFSAGVHNDTSTVSNEISDALNLFKHGLEFHTDGPGVLMADANGPGVHLFQDPDKSEGEISKYSTKDAKSYKEYRKFINRIKKFGDKVLNGNPPNILSLKLKNVLPVAQTAFSLRTLGAGDMTEILRSAPKCVADFLNRWFETDVMKAGMAGPAVYASFTGPWSPLTTLNLLLWEMMADKPVKGGPQAVVTALEKSLKDFGGEIRTGAEVKTVNITDNTIKGVTLSIGETIHAGKVVSSLDPKSTYFKLLSPAHSSAKEKQYIKNFRSRGTAAKIDFAVKGDLNWRDRAGQEFEFVRTGQTLDTVEQSFDVLKYKTLPERPTLDIFVPTVSDKSLAPDGHHVVSVLVNFVPYELKEGWSDTTKAKLKDYVTGVMEDYVAGFGSQVVASRVLTPKDIEDQFGAWGGNINHGELAVDQFLPRPVPGMDQYKTTINGFYLCGSGTFPSGGMSLRNGALAADQII